MVFVFLIPLGTLRVVWCCNCGIDFWNTMNFELRSLADWLLYRWSCGSSIRIVAKQAMLRFSRLLDHEGMASTPTCRTELLGRTQEPQGSTTYKDYQSIELDSASSIIQFSYGGTYAIKSFQRGPLGFRWFLLRTRFSATAMGLHLIGGISEAEWQG